MSEDTNTPMVKVFFEPPDDPDEDWQTTVESMWALPVEQPNAPTGLVYRLENSPWYVFGVSWHDEVCAELRREVFEKPEPAEFDVLYFTRVWKRSGHSTYALFLQGDMTTESTDWKAYWDRVSILGCSYEGMNHKLLAVDVPPEADLERVEEVFEEALAANVFAYQTQHRFDPNEKLGSSRGVLQ